MNIFARGEPDKVDKSNAWKTAIGLQERFVIIILRKRNGYLKGLTIEESVRHIAKFTSGIWQIHPFGEGNTRSTAVFVIKYLKTFGFTVSNETFAENFGYFRNALVRANYNDWQNGIHATTSFWKCFLKIY